MDSFEVEVKRSWFTLRESLRAATKGGKLWTPAIVAVNENWVQILSSEGSVQLRARRLIWTAPNSFRITGIGNGSRIHRSYLRFKSPEQAAQAASIIKRNSSVIEERLVPVEEFPVQATLLLSGTYVMIQLLAFLPRGIVAAVILIFFGSFGTFGIFLGVALVIVYIGLPFWVVFVRARRPTPGWLRFEGTSIVVRTSSDWVYVSPKTIEWKTPVSFVLKSQGSKYELLFPTSESAGRASVMLRTAIPMIQELHVEVQI
jgi:hypothetical protein